jgi:23S rRNA (pseudouridine1915-N3)-methyltransferase
MKLRVISVGKVSDAAGQTFQREFEKRLGKWTAIEWRLISHGNTISSESRAILKQIRPSDYVILLDERGELMDNEDLAGELEKWLGSARQIVFVIGGAHGVDQTVRDRAERVLSFSKLVFPHQLMRILLLEQLYRTFSLRGGGKYHHK